MKVETATGKKKCHICGKIHIREGDKYLEALNKKYWRKLISVNYAIECMKAFIKNI